MCPGSSLKPRVILAVSAIVLAATIYILFVHTPPGPRTLRDFDPDRTAALELDMWQAYYQRRNVRLFTDLVVLLREQYRYTWARAALAGLYLARAASNFAELRGGYDQVLPDLTSAYAMARDWTKGGFNPREVAAAELSWWVARRLADQNSAEEVGRLIAAEYALLYEAPVDLLDEAGLLRARAAKLRDAGGDHADWPAVGVLLRDSYRSLASALGGVGSGPQVSFRRSLSSVRPIRQSTIVQATSARPALALFAWSCPRLSGRRGGEP